MLRRFFSAVLLMTLLGCAGAPSVPVEPQALLRDDAFARPAQAISAAEVFAIDDAMRDYLRSAWPLMRRHGKPKGLVDALYTRGELKLEYDASYTRNASQAFAARAGNCLSLVVMTAALAKELGLEVEFHSAYADETWSRSGTLLLRSGHINITLGRRAVDRARGEDARHWTIDFLPPGEIKGLRTVRLAENTVVSMFMNNRAAEALAREAYDEAYWWAREGLIADPSFVGVINTLGVVYQRSGRLADAERVYNALLLRHPHQTQALHNLSQLLEQQGRHAEAKPLAARLAALEPEPPFHWFVQGQLALRRGDARQARDFFAREVARADYSSEFHYWLALAQYQLGEVEAAQRSLEKAESLSTSSSERDLYAAKLAWLNQRKH
ncbi:MAG: tetratricopeptide repeat protein [Burkholderiaceae bacterium]|nr:tetratricopeptide repeat protein [Burkholderiaceae bacterium]